MTLPTTSTQSTSAKDLRSEYDAIAAERDALAAKLSKITRHARKAGKARWKGTTKAQRSEAMRRAVLARWSKRKPTTAHSHE